MKQEDLIRKKLGCNNPFKTPDGYFDQLTQNVMNSLPHDYSSQKHLGIPLHQPTTMNKKIKLIMGYVSGIAACLLITIGGIRILESRNADYDMQHSPTQVAVQSQEYVNEVLDYAMVSNHEIACYLTDSY